LYTYNATVVGVHDGDTCTLDIDLGFRTHRIQPVRLAGCNARELADPGGQEAPTWRCCCHRVGRSSCRR
jgi:endonuclease YncB( thermonuclease family)